MRLILLYAAQVAFIIAGFAAVSSVFVSINSDAMSSTVTQLLSSTASLATAQALAPLDKFAVQVIAWSDMLHANPQLQSNNPAGIEWTPEDISIASNPLYVSPLEFRSTEGKELMLSFHRNNPLALYVYQTFEMPDNASQMVDTSSTRLETADAPLRFQFSSPSLHRGGTTASPDLIDCVFNFSEDGFGRLTPQVIESDYECVASRDTFGSELQDYQAAARALSRNDSRTGKWIIFTSYYDGPLNISVQLLTFSVPLTFSTPDPVSGEYHCTNAACFDLNAQWLTDALHGLSTEGVHLAMFWDLQESLVAWTLDVPSSDSTGELLFAGSTGSEFDDAIKAFWGAGWCRGPGRLSNCESPSDSSSVTTSRHVFVLRRVVHVNARFTVVISGDHDTFFGPGERARAVGIGVSVAVCVVCLSTSLMLWLTTVRPLRRLRSNMELASTFSSDVDAEGDSCITEVNEANVAFLSMHEQLQMAKPFMPQHLLEQFGVLRQNLDGNRHHNGSGVPSTHDDETRSVVSSSRTKSVRSAHSISPRGTPGATLELRCVAVLVVNISGFDKIVRGISINELQENYAKFIDIILQVVKTQRGVLDSAQGDHIIISFNTTTRCASPAANAVTAAFALRAALNALPKSWHRVTCGISVGHAHCGTLGSSGAKSHATLGTVVRQALGLQRVARALDDQRRDTTTDAGNSSGAVSATAVAPGWCVATARVVQDCSTFAHYRYEAIASLPPSDRTTVIATMEPPPTPPSNTPHLENSGSAEWLYEVDGTTSTNPHRAHNARVHERFSNLSNINSDVATLLHGSAASDVASRGFRARLTATMQPTVTFL